MKSWSVRVVPLVIACAPLVGATACTAQSPASTRTASTPAKLFRHETIEAAWKQAVERRRPMVILFTSDNCPHCVRMLDETYVHAEIRQLLDRHAETAHAHADDYAELIEKLGIRGFPTTLIVAADGQIAGAVEGFVDPVEFAHRIMPWIDPQAATAQVAVGASSR